MWAEAFAIHLCFHYKTSRTTTYRAGKCAVGRAICVTPTLYQWCNAKLRTLAKESVDQADSNEIKLPSFVEQNDVPGPQMLCGPRHLRYHYVFTIKHVNAAVARARASDVYGGFRVLMIFEYHR